MKTSHTHPLQIAEIPVGHGLGRIGVTFCPGKKDPAAMSGAWDRDLGLDVEAIRAWGASAVVTLVEDHELELLRVPALGKAVRERHMAWLHLPIRDVSVPTQKFEVQWAQVGPGLRHRLASGFDVLVHCRGGLGRAGTIASRLLTELGWDPARAIEAVRAVRPGALETTAQEAYVLGFGAAEEPVPSTSGEAIRDRAIGALLGLAVGDAVGTTLEFKARDSYAPLMDMVGGGPFGLEPGQWTDDTSMALALADSLIVDHRLDEADLAARGGNGGDPGDEEVLQYVCGSWK